MESSSESNLEAPPSLIVANKSSRGSYGRWTKLEQILFETLFELYGKNWRKIYDHLNGRRSLAQIRSHAQKYFTKIGPEKLQEMERRSKLLQAVHILSQEAGKTHLTQIKQQEQQGKEKIKEKEEQKFIYQEAQIQVKIIKEEESQNYIQFFPIKIK